MVAQILRNKSPKICFWNQSGLPNCKNLSCGIKNFSRKFFWY